MKHLMTISLVLSGFLSALAQPKTGQQAPEILLPDVSGSIQKLSALSGKVVLLDFWASWCGPCRRSNPALVKLYKKYKDQGFEIYSVSLDDNKTAWKRAISDDKLTWTQVNDGGGWNGPAATIWKIEQIPSSFLIDKSGRIVAVDLPPKAVEQKIHALLKQ